MTLFLCWFLFPALLAALSVGCGLLLERAAGMRLPGALLAPVGFAVMIIAAQFATATDLTAELATPLVVVLALSGFLLVARPAADRSLLRRLKNLERWGLVAVLGVFLMFAAPVLFSGEATWAGYIKLDDTGTWFGITDRVMEHGRNLDGLPLSTYQATLDFNLARGYPVGPFLPLGVGKALTGQDVAWVFQPYLAWLAAMLALTLWTLAAPVFKSQRVRALAVFIAAQPALLFGYAMWGGIKELVAAVVVSLIAALLVDFLRTPRDLRRTLPLAVAIASAMSAMTPSGALIWIGPMMLLAIVLARRLGAPTMRIRPWIRLGGLVSLLTLPWVFGAGFIPPTARPLTSVSARGNLIEPLNPLQLLGVWPAGDFRTDPGSLPLTYLLVAVVAFAALVGILKAGERRAFGALLYSAGVTAAAIIISLIGSPWVGAKALAIGSPALLFAAFLAVGSMFERGGRRGAVALGAVVGIGVLWSNVLAYHDVNLAPRERLLELQDIGKRIAGQGPTLMTEYEPYGPRHFLRDAQPEGASEFGGLETPLRSGVRKVSVGHWADLDDFDLDGLLFYRTLVVRQSPVASRPPSVYRRVWSGRHWVVWQRPSESDVRVAEHLPLGNPLAPNGKASCRAVKQLPKGEGEGEGRLAVATTPDPVIAPLKRGPSAADWPPAPLFKIAQPPTPPLPGQLLPVSSGVAVARVSVPTAGRYRVWLGGAVRGRVELSIAGRRLGSAQQEISYPGHYFALGETTLKRGKNLAAINYEERPLWPGTGWQGPALGPLVLTPVGAESQVSYLSRKRARSLCGKRLDWVEALSQAPRLEPGIAGFGD